MILNYNGGKHMNKVDNYLKDQGLFQVSNLGHKLEMMKNKNEVTAGEYLKAFGYKDNMIYKILNKGALKHKGLTVTALDALVNPNKTVIHLTNVR